MTGDTTLLAVPNISEGRDQAMIGEIIEAFGGLEWLKQDDHWIRLDNEPFMRLVIEWVPPGSRGSLPDRGTVSSSVIALRGSLRDSVYRHAQGPPDRTPYRDCSHLLKEIAPREDEG